MTASTPDSAEGLIRELEGVLRSLTTNDHIDLGDLVYQVRDREGKGWDGPSVKAWSDAVSDAGRVLARAAAYTPPQPVDHSAALASSLDAVLALAEQLMREANREYHVYDLLDLEGPHLTLNAYRAATAKVPA